MKYQISEESSRKIVSLSFLCAVIICAAHVRWSESWWLNPMLETCVRRSLGDSALTFFFIVSGFFLARHYGEPGWWRAAIRKRIGTIVIPFCFWQIVNGIVWFAIEHRWTLRPGGFGLNPFILPKLPPLWYLRNLMLLVAVSPLVFVCLKRWGRRFLSLLFILWLVVGCFMEMDLLPLSSRPGGFLRTTFSFTGLFAFAFGAYLARRPQTLSRRAGNWCGVAALALLLTRAALFRFQVFVPFDVVIPVSMLVLAFAWTHAPSFRLPKALARSTFPIYLMHAIVLQAFCQEVIPFGPFCPWIETLLGVGGPIVVSELLHRFLPRVARFAFGGR